MAAPDYESPTDSDTNNTYVLIVRAVDATGNASTQTITVTVLDLDDVAPVITGPSGGAGAAASAISVNEHSSVVTTVSVTLADTCAHNGATDVSMVQTAVNGTYSFWSGHAEGSRGSA